jgi:hypothetical protein
VDQKRIKGSRSFLNKEEKIHHVSDTVKNAKYIGASGATKKDTKVIIAAQNNT